MNIGITCVEDLIGQNPEDLYVKDCMKKGFQVDRCQLYLFRMAVYYAENTQWDAEKLKWWYWKDNEYPENLSCNEEMILDIRKYQTADCQEVIELFCNTVHTVNAKDYTQAQLDAWTFGVNPSEWDKSLQAHYSLVAANGRIVGFGDIDETGYLNRLYVHKDFQHLGIATAICDELEKFANCSITTHASVTAKPFFEKRGYTILKRQQVERQGILLTNYIMKK